VLAFTAFHDVVSGSLSLPAKNGDGRYLFVLNYVDQTVSVIDTNSHTVIDTVALPSGTGFSSCLYRSANKTGWFFGNSGYAVMDCDPASGTFRSILSNGFLGINSAQSGCAYDYINDIIYTGCANNAIFKLVPDTLALTNLGTYIGITPARSHHMYFISSLKAIYFGDDVQGQFILSTDIGLPIYGFAQGFISQMRYNLLNGKLYQVGNEQVIVRSVNPVKQVASINNTAIRRGSLTLIPSVNKGYTGSYLGNEIGVFNTSSDTNIGTLSKSSLAANEFGTRMVLYSSYSDRVYAQAMNNSNQTTGVDRIHIFNPNTDTHQGYIVVGNMAAANSQLAWVHQMFLNQIIL
jgi:YVTN family beta-propeller protein